LLHQSMLLIQRIVGSLKFELVDFTENVHTSFRSKPVMKLFTLSFAKETLSNLLLTFGHQNVPFSMN